MTGTGFIDGDLWSQVETALPIACVDVLPVQLDTNSRITAIGLILRVTHVGERKWCLVGGRVLYEETLREAIARQITSTLGDHTEYGVLNGERPVTVAQYAPSGSPRFLRDPRKHAIGITYLATLAGDVRTCGEALAFRWFTRDSTVERSEVGFDQDQVIDTCVAYIDQQSTRGWWP